MSDMPACDLFPLSRCPNCGYSLHGLGDAGRCPECGEAYDCDTLILYGWAPARFRHPGTTIVYVAAVCLAIFLLIDAALLLVGLLAMLATGHFELMWYPLFFVLGYGSAATALLFLARWARRRGRRVVENVEGLGVPRMQLRIGPGGYAFRRGYGKVRYLRWISTMEVDLSREGAIAFLRIARLAPVGTTDWTTLVHIAFPATAEQGAAVLSRLSSFRRSVVR
ncbi:MAG TPA: hypothetical protein VHM90_06480 [Phycisphaerae bacterium]|nr:hypothetical protein [Phycisphaerae bacterium]